MSFFLMEEQKQDAVIRKIEVVGEATKKISQKVRNKYTDIPWRAIAGMRDKLIHDYFDVDLDTVWQTAQVDIPYLIPQLEKIRQELELVGELLLERATPNFILNAAC